MKENQGLKSLKDFIFFSKYSKQKGNKKESWPEAVNRVMGMHDSYLRTKQSVLDAQKTINNWGTKFNNVFGEAKESYLEQEMIGAQRSLQFGGESLLKHHMRMYNCFGIETKFVTSEGVKSFFDYQDGDEVLVPTHKGNWKKAIVKSYGEQKLNSISINRGNSRQYVIRATENHRWFKSNGGETTNLEVGDRLLKTPETFQEFEWENASPFEKLYWCYGMVYGDGTLNKSNKHLYSMIRLCGHDKRYANRFREMGFKSSKELSIGEDDIFYTGRYEKNAPNPSVDSPELIRAFVGGYLDADAQKNLSEGCHTKYVNIQSSEKDHIEFIRECFPIAGVYIVSEEEMTGQVTNYGTRPYTIRFKLTTGQGKMDPKFKVNSIEEDVTETVWCLEVEDDASFMLEFGLPTGNCSSTYADRVSFFHQLMYVALCGAGAGYSVSKHHTKHIPVVKPDPKAKKYIHVIEDSIEGWSNSIKALTDYHFYGKSLPEFDYSAIRPKGAFITGGFKAPGPEPLEKCINLLHKYLSNAEGRQLRPFEVHLIACTIADAVISGGVRRSALIVLFDADDEEMLTCKTGDWFVNYSQLARSNNSAIILPHTPKEDYLRAFEMMKQYGEPGFAFVKSIYHTYNPCFEIGKFPTLEPGNPKKSGWATCNLTEIHGGKVKSKEDFYRAARSASILGTFQAAYTDFEFLGEVTKAIVERDALIGVGITGMGNNPDVLFDPDVQQEAARIVKEANEEVAELLGINFAARTTCIKPSGNSSQMLGTSSGIHPFHSKRYIRNVQVNNEEQAGKVFKRLNKFAAEPSSYNPADSVLSFPVELEESVMTKEKLNAQSFMDLVRSTQANWVEAGTNKDHASYQDEIGQEGLTHNVSNTITLQESEFDTACEYLWENKKYFCGVSFLRDGGDLDYAQSPYIEVLDEVELAEKFGKAAIMASGLIVDGLHAFNGNLYAACDTALGILTGNKRMYSQDLSLSKEDIKNYIDSGISYNIEGGLVFKAKINGIKVENVNDVISTLKSSKNSKKDWVRRFEQFAKKYLNGDLMKCSECLKRTNMLHKWAQLERIQPIDYSKYQWEEDYVDVDTLAAQACHGGACEI